MEQIVMTYSTDENWAFFNVKQANDSEIILTEWLNTQDFKNNK